MLRPNPNPNPSPNPNLSFALTLKNRSSALKRRYDLGVYCLVACLQHSGSTQILTLASALTKRLGKRCWPPIKRRFSTKHPDFDWRTLLAPRSHAHRDKAALFKDFEKQKTKRKQISSFKGAVTIWVFGGLFTHARCQKS
eukprot:sb/3474334/